MNKTKMTTKNKDKRMNMIKKNNKKGQEQEGRHEEER